MSKLYPPRLPVAPAEPGESETKIEAAPVVDDFRKRIMEDDRLSIMHTRLYDHWRALVGAPTAYRLALVGWSDEAEYQRLKREVAAS